MRFINLLLVIALAASLGCQSTRYKEFSDVKPGMNKAHVLGEVGGPDSTRRSHGKDRWIYNYELTPSGPQTREVEFQDGHAVYIGDQVKPAVSAEEQDRINEKLNAEAEKREAQEHARWADEHGVAYRRKTGDELDRDDVALQQSLYGTRDLKRERLKVAPNFQEIN